MEYISLIVNNNSNVWINLSRATIYTAKYTRQYTKKQCFLRFENIIYAQVEEVLLLVELLEISINMICSNIPKRIAVIHIRTMCQDSKFI